MERVTLFSLEGPSLKVSMQLYFNEQGQLIFDGYDIGSFVNEMFGDTDYEYNYTIQPEEVDKLYKIFSLEAGNRSGLLNSLKERFSVNEAYSLFGKFLDEHDIKYDSFTWT